MPVDFTTKNGQNCLKSHIANTEIRNREYEQIYKTD